MKEYLKKFETMSQYQVYTASTEYITPNVSYIEENNTLIYNDRKYLTFKALENGTFKFSGSTTANTLSYSTDEGTTWTPLADNTDTPTVTAGNTIMFKGTCTPQTDEGIGRFSSTARFDAEGNVMSLLFGDDSEGKTSLSGKAYAFYGLFSGCTTIVNAENMRLPATTLASSCYNSMFRGCTSLTTAPELPATAITSSCYNCMFYGCTSLTTAPELPATTLASYCYYYMFYRCNSLTTAPELPATTLASNCYAYMFYRCNSLTTAPELPALELVSYCYQYMFQNCTNLNYIKAMFIREPGSSSTNSWVNGVASSGTFVMNSNAEWNTGTTACGASTYPCNWTVETAPS